MIDQQKEDQDQVIDNAVILHGDNGNHTLDQPEEPSAENLAAGVSERLTREKNKDAGDVDDEVWNITLKTFCFLTFHLFITFNSILWKCLVAIILL